MKTPESQPNQEATVPNEMPVVGKEIKAEEGDDLIKLKTHKNNERGTELIYATVPLDEFNLRSPDFEKEVRDLLDKVYGKDKVFYKLQDENIDARFYEAVNDFIKNPDEKEFTVRLHEQPKENTLLEGERLYPEHFVTLRKIGKQLIISQTPVIHTITGGIARRWEESGTESVDGFEDLMNILEHGFHTNFEENYRAEGNSVLKLNKKDRIQEYMKASGKTDPTKGDTYNIEIFPSIEKNNIAHFAANPSSSFVRGPRDYRLGEASLKNVSAINIQLPEDSSEEEKAEKMKYYREQITLKYGIPVRFNQFNR